MVFDEKVLYKDKFCGDLECTIPENFEFVNLDIPKYTPQDQRSDMRIPVITQDEAGSSTPPLGLSGPQTRIHLQITFF